MSTTTDTDELWHAARDCGREVITAGSMAEWPLPYRLAVLETAHEDLGRVIGGLKEAGE